MKLTKQTIKYTLIAVFSGLLSLAALAGAGHHDKHLIKALDLTDAQITQMKTLRESHGVERQQNHEAMKAIKQKKQALLVNYDAKEAEKIAQEAAEIFKTKMLTKLQHQQALYAMLDDDQKQKYTNIIAKHGKGKHGKYGAHKHEMVCDD